MTTLLKRLVAYPVAVIALQLGTAWAQEAPDALVKRVSEEILAIAKTDKQVQAGNQERIMEVVRAKILPHINFQRMTQLTAGRYWREATPEQQQALTNEFRTLLVYTYAGAVAQIRNQTLEFKPMRATPDDTEVEVRTAVIQSRGEPIQLNYRLEKGPNGWKIVDVNILGAWLVQTYRNSFAAEIQKGGIDGLIKALNDRNKQLSADPPKPAAKS
ncbi:MAG: phospholipid-binding protein MlaC [Burkholderiaceae bacterium]|jgi:phospholipid transport system substrate-binding protein|nr:ABC transporter substrate-binding protein [Oxalobacteraceae bacterium]